MSVPASPDAPEPSSGRDAIDDLFAQAYDELRRLAGHLRRHDGRATIDPTALVNEAWMKLAAGRTVSPASHLHFKRLAARAMRQVLVDHARARRAEKRGGAGTRRALDDVLLAFEGRDLDVIALHEALEALAALSPRQAEVVTLRYFGGLSVTDTAAQLGVSISTIESDFRLARAWLRRRLSS
jgi:RNA polymerase sigma-70 factor (ECF subfamily)